MSCDRALGKKRKILRNIEQISNTKGPSKIKNVSPEERNITFIYDNLMKQTLKIKSSFALKNTLFSLNFQIPYYIDEYNREIILINDDDLFNFFHSTKYSTIYNYKFYTYFKKDDFDAQFKASQREQWTNIKKLFYNNEYFCKNHLNSYSYISFKKVNFNFYNFRDTIKDHVPINVIEIFTKKGIGISTHMFLYFLKYREYIRANEKFIPFLIFKYPELIAAKTINLLYFLLNYAIVNCFVFFNDYENYATHLFSIIKEKGFRINEIIFEIINDILDIWAKKKYLYLPRVIVDRYSFKLDEDESFKNKLYKDSKKLGYKLYIIYSFKEKKTNEVLYDYLTNKKPQNFMFSFTDTLYSNIEYLPSKYPQIYSIIYPKISNYIKLQNCYDFESAQKLVESEYNEINKDLSEFYENDDIKFFYINQCINIIKKDIDLNNNKTLFMNIPFEIFDFREFENEKGKIFLFIKSETGFNVLENISNTSVLSMLKNPQFNKLNNYIQGGIVKRAVIQLIKDGNTPFGEFENYFKIDCFLNIFKKKDYDFPIKELEAKIKKLKHYKKLKDIYSKIEYKGKPILIIPFNNNSKEWDLAFIIKSDNGKIKLCLIQISVNITIKKIQIMLTNFINKQKYITYKIKEIYGIGIESTIILFILSKQLQNLETIEFLKKYDIPFIYFKHNEEPFDFRNRDNSPLKKFKLLPEHHYKTNKDKFDKSLTYKGNNEIQYDNDNDNDYDYMDDNLLYEDIYTDDNKVELNNIIENNFINNEIV